MRWKFKRRKHLKNKLKCVMQKREKYNKKKRRSAIRHHGVARNKKKSISKKFSLPEDFRIYENFELVSSFFNDVFHFIRVESVKKSEFNIISLYFDSSEIVQADNAAIMYFLAIMNSSKNLGDKTIKLAGNLPRNDECRSLFLNSGFLSYCDYTSMPDVKTADNIKIKYGNGQYNPEVFKPIYEMISPDKTNAKFLAPVLIEVIDNSVQHAYSCSNVFKGKEWYFFFEESEESFVFIVLDTGVGIPQTVRKNFMDKLKKISQTFNPEASLIKSALTGKFRTSTGEKNRGNGLPKIYECCTKGNLSSMEILSGRAYCKIDKSGEITAKDKGIACNGTMYRWQILKEELK